MSSSSTSSSERDWKKFQLAGLAAAAVTSLLVLSTLAIIDPYRVFAFSPSFDRQPLAAQRGLSVAGLARNPDYDSAALGSSTVQIMRPADLNGLLGGRFVNLSLWGGTAWMQKHAAQLFARHHPAARTVIMAIDSYWCSGGILDRHIGRRQALPATAAKPRTGLNFITACRANHLRPPEITQEAVRTALRAGSRNTTFLSS